MTLAARLLRNFVVGSMVCVVGLHSMFPPSAAALPPTEQRNDSLSSRPAAMFTPNLNRTAEHRRAPPEQRYPIQQLPVNRDTYFKWLQFSTLFRYADNPSGHGKYGPRHFLPVLAHYVQSGEQKNGLACIAMLKEFHRCLRQEVAQKGWHAMFCEEMGYIGLYRKYLIAGGLLEKDSEWLRDLIVDFARGIHPWDSPQSFWRGPMHRAQGEAVIRGLAARWYPNLPEAAEWSAYSDLVYQDWWRFRDFAANDTNYLFVTLQPLFLRAALLADHDFFTDPQMASVWDRLIQEVSPDGSIPPYGTHVGWNDTAGKRIAMLEMIAAATGDGRYRYVAHRLMNYLIYQRNRYREHHILLGPQTTEPLALAFLFADDRIKPVEPDSGSMVLYRKEIVRLPGYGTGPRDKALAEPLIGRPDPSPDRGFIDCGLLVSDEEKPSKLVLRSGWNPGDFYALVDLFPRHDPLNTLGILGMTRWGSALTCAISAKSVSDENRVLITPRATSSEPRKKSQAPETRILDFADSLAATFASATVDRYDFHPITCSRHFLFVKNEFLVVRDTIVPSQPISANVASVFNTQNIGPLVSSQAALTYMSQPAAVDVGLLNPPVDLLVFHCPQKGGRLSAVDRTATDPRARYVRNQLRYERDIELESGKTYHFSTFFRPQTPPDNPALVSADPDPRGGDGGPRLDTAFIQVVLDNELATVIRIEGPQGREQWAVINPTGAAIKAGDLETDARAAYIETPQSDMPRSWSHRASRLRVRGNDIAVFDPELAPKIP